MSCFSSIDTGVISVWHRRKLEGVSVSEGNRCRDLSIPWVIATITLSVGGSVARADEAAENTPAKTDDGAQTVVVTGYRGALRSALNLKKTADVMVDAINAEDISKFPDSNLAESLQRLPGIALDRDNG